MTGKQIAEIFDKFILSSGSSVKSFYRINVVIETVFLISHYEKILNVIVYNTWQTKSIAMAFMLASIVILVVNQDSFFQIIILFTGY